MLEIQTKTEIADLEKKIQKPRNHVVPEVAHLALEINIDISGFSRQRTQSAADVPHLTLLLGCTLWKSSTPGYSVKITDTKLLGRNGGTRVPGFLLVSFLYKAVSRPR